MEAQGSWIEVTARKDEFTKIIRLLVDFDENTGRYRRYQNQASHWLRRAVSVSGPDQTRILIRHQGGFVYSVIAEIRTGSGFAATAWVHEDGIRLERDQKEAEPRHPVHSIVCLTDLFVEGKAVDFGGISPETQALIDEAR